MRSDIVAGGTFPDYALPDHTGTARALSDLQGGDPASVGAQWTFLSNGYWFWGRPSVDDLWRDLRAATREIRPDWDLNAPGLREAWAAGERGAPFHGWDRRSAGKAAGC